jgi:Fe2+ transport system protein FeoA
MKLSQVSEGSSCILSRFDSNHLSVEFINDLMDIGLLPETSLQVLKIYRSMNKLLLAVGKGEVGLRITDADHIEVRYE